MKKSIKLIATTLVSSAAFNLVAQSLNTVNAQEWVERSAAEIKESLGTVHEDGTVEYQVQWGDTLTKIAQALDMDLKDLVAINGIDNPDMIIAGTILTFDPSHDTLALEDQSGETTEYDVETGQEIVEDGNLGTAVDEWLDEDLATPEADVPTSQAPVSYSALVTEDAPVEASLVETSNAGATEALANDAQLDVSLQDDSFAEPEVISETEAQADVVEVAETLETSEAPEISEGSAWQAEVEASEETTEVVSESPVSEPVVEETVEEVSEEVAPVASSAQTTEEAAPVAEETVIEESGVSPSTGLSMSEAEAKEWIANKESGGDYNAINPTGKYIGRYQLTNSYLNGDYSPENQERVANEYVINRYGSWVKAQQFWQANGWY